MALTDFFRINLPYGIAKNENYEWMAFNREYLPLGFNNKNGISFNINGTSSFPVHTKYRGITEEKLLSLAWDDDSGIKRDDNGKITTIFLYNDRSNPTNSDKADADINWETYINKLKKLSAFQI